MSAIRVYLEEKAALPEKEWLRRDPRSTHPEILAAVAEALASGLSYDDDVERFVEARAGDLPEHRHHGHEERARLTSQLGSEVYLAKKIIRDQEALEAELALRAEGWRRLDYALVEDGARYRVRRGVVYVGRNVPEYGEAEPVTARALDGSFVLVPRGHRNGVRVPAPALVKAGWSA